jgi:hypothetical protein
VLRVIDEVDLATVGWLREHQHKYMSINYRGWCWTAPRRHFWRRVGSTCWWKTPSRPAPKDRAAAGDPDSTSAAYIAGHLGAAAGTSRRHGG